MADADIKMDNLGGVNVENVYEEEPPFVEGVVPNEPDPEDFVDDLEKRTRELQ